VTLVAALRDAGIATDVSYGDRGLKGAMKGADRSGARFAIVLGDRDLDAGAVQCKDLASGEQEAVPLDLLVDHLRKRIA
jgi:histidyl-tRNA synthetase